MPDVKPPDEARAVVQPGVTSVGFLLSQLGFVTSRGFCATLAPLSLEPRQFLLLRLVESNEGKSQQALGEALHIPPSRMVAVVDELEGRGLLERRANPVDRRVRSLHVTREGRRVLGEAMRLAIDYETRICEDLRPEERETLLGLLQRLAGRQGLSRQVHPELTTPEADCAS